MRYPRDVDALAFFEDFLIASVGSILVIRLFLHLSGYPTVGGDALHIAHMLWGGLFMLVALLLLLMGLPDRSGKHLAAVLGGIGFGTFIDELGKFITHDNDYFFQPTVALIYLIFVLLYVGVHALYRRDLHPEEQIANAWELARSGSDGSLDEESRSRIQALLEALPPGEGPQQVVQAFLAGTAVVPGGPPSLWTRAKDRLRATYGRLVRWRWFGPAVVTFFVGHTSLGLLRSLLLVRSLWLPAILLAGVLILAAGAVRLHQRRKTLMEGVFAGTALVLLAGAGWGVIRAAPLGALSFFEWGDLLSTAAPAVLILRGVGRLRISRLGAYQSFYHAVLVFVFVSHFFAFYHNELVAVFGFSWNLVVLITLRYMISQEEAPGAG